MKKQPVIIISLIAMGLFYAGVPPKSGNTFVSDNGKIHFFASTPLEDIEATSNNGGCVLNTETKKISAKVLMSTFQFSRKKMQDDFNEDYAESGKYPFAKLDAVITDNSIFTKDGVYNVTLKGTLELHGTKKDVELKGKLTVKNNQPAQAQAKFDVALADYNFKIPTVVVAKIAKIVTVDVNFEFRKY